MNMQEEYNYDNNYYDQGIGGFHKASLPYIHENFDKYIGQNRLGKILDFGCGNGFHSAYLKSKCRNLHGVDFSEAIKKNEAQKNYKELFFYDLGGKVELPENYYDLLFSIEVIEHVKDYRKFLANANTALKSGGQIFLTTTTYFWSIFILLVFYRRKISFKNLYHFFRGWTGSEKYKTLFVLEFWDFFTGHYHGFSKNQLKKGFKENGFVIEAIKFLPIQSVVIVDNLKHHLTVPYTGKHKFFVRSGAMLLYIIGNTINYVCKIAGLYSPNILVVARKK